VRAVPEEAPAASMGRGVMFKVQKRTPIPKKRSGRPAGPVTRALRKLKMNECITVFNHSKSNIGRKANRVFGAGGYIMRAVGYSGRTFRIWRTR
jgi:hypothetical protein